MAVQGHREAPGQNRTGQGCTLTQRGHRTGQDRTGLYNDTERPQDRTGQGCTLIQRGPRTGQDRTGQDRAVH